MTKTLNVKGMTCNHCAARVKEAIEALPGTTAEVDLEGERVTVTLTQEISDESLKNAVTEAGYDVVSIS